MHILELCKGQANQWCAMIEYHRANPLCNPLGGSHPYPIYIVPIVVILWVPARDNQFEMVVMTMRMTIRNETCSSYY